MEQINTFEYIKRIDEKGYVFVNVNGRWIREHIFVVETFLNRSLKEEECIHHIDFNKYNNDISNLCLMTNKEHSHWHRQYKQFGMTRPLRRFIENNIIQVKLRELNNE